MNLDDMNEYYRRREEERRKAQENGTVNAPHYTVEDAEPKAAAKHRKGGGAGRLVAVALVCALVSMCFVPPSPDYLDYIDFRVLALLFCLMAVVAGLQQCGLFALLAQRLLSGRRPLGPRRAGEMSL